MPWLAPQLPLKIPVPTFVGEPSPRYPWPFAGYEMVPGRSLPTARLSRADRTALALPLARFLAALHSIPSDAASRHGAGPDLLDRLNVGRRLHATRERLNVLYRAGVVEDADLIEAILEAAPAIEAPRSDTVVHGDLHAGQILIGYGGRLTGVIDWGDAHLGDPIVDLAAVHVLLPQEAHGRFRRAYGPIGRPAWLAARARAVWHTLCSRMRQTRATQTCCRKLKTLLGAS